MLRIKSRLIKNLSQRGSLKLVVTILKEILHITDNFREKVQLKEKGWNIMIMKFCLMVNFKEIRAINKLTSRSKWRKISNLDLNSNSRLGELFKENLSIYQIIMIKVIFPNKKKFPCLIIKFCLKAVLKEIQAIKIHILKNKWRKINNSDQNNSLRLEESSRDNLNMLLTTMIKDILLNRKKNLYLRIKSFQKEIFKVIRAINKLILRNRWKRTSNFGLSNR